VLYFPESSAAVGFSCSGCGSSVPLTLNDYHGYALASNSPYHNAATDGTDIGPSVGNIDAAQVNNLYVWPCPCGSLAPFHDMIAVVPPVFARLCLLKENYLKETP
jgi:hypothetical protein